MESEDRPVWDLENTFIETKDGPISRLEDLYDIGNELLTFSRIFVEELDEELPYALTYLSFLTFLNSPLSINRLRTTADLIIKNSKTGLEEDSDTKELLDIMKIYIHTDDKRGTITKIKESAIAIPMVANERPVLADGEHRYMKLIHALNHNLSYECALLLRQVYTMGTAMCEQAGYNDPSLLHIAVIGAVQKGVRFYVDLRLKEIREIFEQYFVKKIMHFRANPSEMEELVRSLKLSMEYTRGQDFGPDRRLRPPREPIEQSGD
jgi:hypothetical protein